MHYMNIAPGILKKFGLMTVKLIGTLWNVKKKKGSGLCMDSMYLSPPRILVH